MLHSSGSNHTTSDLTEMETLFDRKHFLIENREPFQKYYLKFVQFFLLWHF